MNFLERLHQQLESDAMTLEALGKAGDNSQAPRIVEHQFTCEYEENLGCLGYLFEQMQLGEAELSQANEGFRLDLSIQSTTEWTEITRTSLLMKCFAAAVGAEYQGWGSPVTHG